MEEKETLEYALRLINHAIDNYPKMSPEAAVFDPIAVVLGLKIARNLLVMAMN